MALPTLRLRASGTPGPALIPLSLLESALDGVLDSDMSGSEESGASADVENASRANDENMTVESVQAALLSQVSQPPAPVAFVGRGFRLDDAPASADSQEDAPASDDSQEPMCRRCGDRENLHLMNQSGPWLDAESDAERTYCTDCLYG